MSDLIEIDMFNINRTHVEYLTQEKEDILIFQL
jgi:hypothetical protein